MLNKILEFLKKLFEEPPHPLGPPSPQSDAVSKEYVDQVSSDPSMEITLDEYLMGRDKEYPITEEQYNNTIETVRRVNLLLEKGEARPLRATQIEWLTVTTTLATPPLL